MNIIGICRFSLVGRGDWKAYEGKSEAEVQAVAIEQAARLFTPERMETRLKTFKELTLASIRAQTDPDFQFLVLASELMPQQYRDELARLCASVPQVVLRFFPVMDTKTAQKAVFRELRVKYSDTLQFRLDDDDCVCADFVALLRRHAAPAMPAHPIFAVSLRGVMYCSVGGQNAGTYHWPVAFMSAGAAIRHPSKSIYEFGHFSMAQRFPSITIPGRLALVTHTGTNDTHLSPALIQRRGMVPMTGPQIQQALAVNFSFLSDKAMALAGLPATPSPEEPAPRWLTDLTSTRARKGFFISDDLFGLQHTHRGGKVLYVSFDNLSSVRAPTRRRDPWGCGFAAASNWSSLGVLCYRPNWFRIPRLFEELQRLAQRGFFSRYDRVIFSGVSMGAYAACAFSSVVPGSTVIAFSPQSTLAPGIADWDRRYPSGTAADWHGPFADAARELAKARRAWIVYDPAVPEDHRHAERLAGPCVTLLRARHSSHFSAQFLSQIGVLGRFARDCAEDRMTEARFYALYRRGRHFRRYLEGVAAQVARRPGSGLKRQLAAVLRDLGKPAIANHVERSVGHHPGHADAAE